MKCIILRAAEQRALRKVALANDLVSKNRILCNASAGGKKDRVFLHSVYARLLVCFSLSFAFNPFALLPRVVELKVGWRAFGDALLHRP